MKKYVLIQVRSSSSRLPFKALLNINNIPLIILLFRRIVSKSYKTVILTSNHSSDDYLCKELKKYKINFYRGNLPNVKKRFLDYSKNFNDNDIIVRLTADCLFVDKWLVKFVIKQLQKNSKEYLYTNPKISGVPEGISVEAFRLKTLRRFKKNSNLDKEHVTVNFDRIKENTVLFEKKKKQWKNLSTSIDTLDDFYKVKKVFNGIKNPSSIKWQSLCEKLGRIKPNKKIIKKTNFVLESFYTKNLNKNLLIKISNLKNQEWKFGKKSQLDFFKKNYSKLDLHNLFFCNEKLIVYKNLKKNYFYIFGNSKIQKKKKCLIFDTFIIHKNYQKMNLSEILMSFNKSLIYKLNLPSFLVCSDSLVKFYNKNRWLIIDDKRIILTNKFKNLNLFSLNINTSQLFSSKREKIFIKI